MINKNSVKIINLLDEAQEIKLAYSNLIEQLRQNTIDFKFLI